MSINENKVPSSNEDEQQNELLLEVSLYNDISLMIEQTRSSIASHANQNTIYLFWCIGKRVNETILKNKRATYGKQIVSTLSTQLVEVYGRSFSSRNIRRMIQFSEQFSDFGIVSTLTTQLSWSHIVEILPLKSLDSKLYYLKEANQGIVSVGILREMIHRKAYERKEIANSQAVESNKIPMNTFKDPYLFDVLGLKDDYLENDLETAILCELEKFILEFGKGFAFMERQKRMVIDGEDFYLDLLFYNRHLKRLVAVELKQGKFKADYSGQLRLYLKWLNRYERQEGENEPIGLILCSEGNREQIELLEMDKEGIMVAQYWTTLPPKEEFEQRIQSILAETKERIQRRRSLTMNESDKI